VYCLHCSVFLFFSLQSIHIKQSNC